EMRDSEGAWRTRGGLGGMCGAGRDGTGGTGGGREGHEELRNVSACTARASDNGDMDWQSTSEDTVPSARVTEADARLLHARPPVTGAWRDGDPAGERKFVSFGAFRTETGAELPNIRIAYESWGELNATRDNAILVLHALTGDSHLRGDAGAGHPTAGW